MFRQCRNALAWKQSNQRARLPPGGEPCRDSGLGSIRGARLAEQSYARATSSQMQRPTDPLVWRYGQMQPTS
jgi:arsenite oxidase large subunit